MIKTKKCSECDNTVFSKGLCKFHAPKKGIKNSRKETVEKRKELKQKRDVYFDHHISRCKYSEESLTPIPNPTRANICHILDKSRHPSLQDHLDNVVYYTQEEHEKFDRYLSSLDFEKLEKEFKNSWQKVCDSLEILLPLCQENTVLTRALEKYINGRKAKSQ